MIFNFNFTGDITAYTVDTYGDETEINDGDDISLPVDFKLTTTGEFDSTPYIEYDDDWGNTGIEEEFNLSTDNTSATLYFDPSDVDYQTEMTINASAPEQVITYTIEFNDTENLDINIPLDNSFTEGDNPEIILTADEGYYFKEVPEVIFQDEYGNSIGEFFTTEQTADFKTEYSLMIEQVILDEVEDPINVECSVNSAVREIPENLFDGYGIFNIYQLNADKLQEIELLDPTEYPLSDFVLELKRLFVDVNPDLIEEVNLKLGSYETDVTVKVLNTTVAELDLGSVTIPEKYENANDYNNTEIEIFLPFLGFEKLDAENVINKTINLIYKVNIMNGDTSIMLLDSEETLIAEFDCVVGYEVPYYIATSTKSKLAGKLELSNKYLLGFTPYILHRTYEPINSVYKKEFGVKQFNEISGFYKFSDINLNQSGLIKNEYDEIMELLNEGVIF